MSYIVINFNLGTRQYRLAKRFWNFQTIRKLYGIPVYKMTKISCKVYEKVSTFFHPANRPIDFVKSFLFGFFLLIRLGLGLS